MRFVHALTPLFILAVLSPVEAGATGSVPSRDVEQAERTALAAKDPAVTRDLARQIAARHGRAAAGPLVEDLIRQGFDANGLIVPALVEIADPTDEQGLKSAMVKPASGTLDSTGLAVVAVATPADAAARDLLLRVAKAEGAGKRFDGRAALYAAGLLRGYDAKEVRPAVEAALRDENLWPVPRQYLRALQSSLDYADKLTDEKDQGAYRAFERRQWRALALAPKDFRKAGVEYGIAAAAILKEDSGPDERFILRTLADPAATEAETAIAHDLAVALRTPPLRQQLATLAGGGSPRANVARSTLDEIARRDRDLTSRPPVPKPSPGSIR